jgi:phospho-N-acetylmuramoyl-pentapeptide-transferase
MLYLLFFPFSDRIPILNVLRYPSFRILAAGLVALGVGLLLGPSYIEAMRNKQYGVSAVREDTPEAHQKKKGTPSMGGGLILWALLLATLLFADLTSRLVWAALIFTLGFGLIGFADDWLKFTKRNSKGLAGRKKLFWQTVIFVVVIAVFFVDWKAGIAHPRLLLDTRLSIPFVKVKSFSPVLPWWLYLIFAFFVIVGTSNAVNLTDGLDGLAVGPSIVSSLTFLLLAYLAGLVIKGFNIADYLLIPHIEGAQELAVFCSAMAGAGISFLWFNTYPASVFMGDVGALAIGGGLGALAVLTKNEVDSAVIHGVFFAEALSVMLQVFWFKRTGKRIFRMAPIHHHFELQGWAEPKIIVRFWIASIILALFALASIKLR